MLVPEFVALIVFHHDIANELGPGDEIVENGEDGERHIEKVHDIYWILLVNERVMGLQDQPISCDHWPDETLVLKDMGFDDYGSQLNRSHTLFWNELL